MKFEINGLDEFQQKLDHMSKAAEELSGPHVVSFNELFSVEFMEEHTQFSSFNQMLKTGGFQIESPKDFEALPEELLDKHVAATTDFDSWEDMLQAGTERYVLEKLDI